MIQFETLDDQEVVYSWENPDPPGGVRLWCMTRLEAWCRETKRKVFHSTIDQDKAEWYLDNRGIELHRVKWLMENPLALMNPCILMRLYRHALVADQTPWDLMLDGHHRYVALAMLRKPIFTLWHLTEEEARPFEVVGFPQSTRPLNVNAFSGLGLDP